MTPPRNYRGKWTFAAKRPEKHPKDTPWICKVGDDTVTINKWTRAKPTDSEQRMNGFNRWYHVPPETSNVPPTQIDESQQSESFRSGDDASHATKRAKPSSPSKERQGASPVKPAIKKSKTATETKGPGDTVIWDLHGVGDCGFRAIAAAIAVRSGKSKEYVEKNIGKMVTTIKARGINFLKEHAHWRETWTLDPDANRITEDGAIPTSADEYLDSLCRPNRWIDGLFAQAIASAIKKDFLIWDPDLGT